MVGESIDNQDESKLLGYFETIRGNFLLKTTLLFSLSKQDGQEYIFDKSIIPSWAITELEKHFPDPIFYKALNKENKELTLNLQEDIVTSTISGAWVVFEQTIKDLLNINYSRESGQQNMNYQNGKFGFTKSEKKDLDLFYYIRNAIFHYNGAYNSYKNIDHTYNGVLFRSQGNIGNKININIMDAFAILSDLEKYCMKAWHNAK